MRKFYFLLFASLFAAGCGSLSVQAVHGRANNDPIPTPAWVKNEPLIVVGNWDSMPIFRRRVGGNPMWQEDEYRKEQSEETVRKLKDLGVTLAVIHFYKGFGLVAEKEHIDDARRLAQLLKKYGIRVGVYVGSTIAYETFLAEEPDAENWFVPDYMGKPVFYYDQTFRKRVYFMHPGYREYMKKVLRMAVEDIKADEIDFDNTSLQAQPPIFQHPLAITDFRTYLQNRYPPEILKKRFGFTQMRYVLPPRYDKPLTTISDPLFQEWADFRCEQLRSYYHELADYIRSLNPNVAIATNPHSGISGKNTVWDQGVDYPAFLPNMDIVWTEEGNEAKVTPDGILISKIRTYKMATSLNSRVITYTAGAGNTRVQMAESMAFNRQSLGMVGSILAGYDLPQDQRAYIDFFRKHFDYFRDVRNVADIAVLHSHASMAFNNGRPWQSAMLLEQALIQAKVPFDIIFDQQLKDLSRYKVLALPDQECLTDQQAAAIRKFVEGGGGLLATEHTSLYTEWRQRRRDFALADLFKVSAALPPSRRAPDAVLDVAPTRNQFGRGRVAYIPEIKPAIEKPASVAMTSEYWKLPQNFKEIIESARWAAGGDFSLDLKAPVTVAAEVLEQAPAQRLFVHLINYDAMRTPAIKNVTASLSIPAGRNVRSVTLLSPDEAGPQNAAFTLKDGRLNLTVPSLATYKIAAIQLD